DRLRGRDGGGRPREGAVSLKSRVGKLERIAPPPDSDGPVVVFWLPAKVDTTSGEYRPELGGPPGVYPIPGTPNVMLIFDTRHPEFLPEPYRSRMIEYSSPPPPAGQVG